MLSINAFIAFVVPGISAEGRRLMSWTRMITICYKKRTLQDSIDLPKQYAHFTSPEVFAIHA